MRLTLRKKKVSYLNWFVGTWLGVYFLGFVIFVVLFPNTDIGKIKYETFTSGWLEVLVIVFALAMMVRKDVARLR